MMVERPVASKSLATPTARAAGAPLEPCPVPASPTHPNPPVAIAANRVSRWQATHDLAYQRAATDRVKILVDFLARPVHAHGGTDPDPDIVTAYNLAVEAALNAIRHAAQATAG